MFVAFEGNAGVGKSTLAKSITQKLGWNCVLEPNEDELNSLHLKYNTDSFKIQVECLAQRLAAQYQISKYRQEGKNVVSDFIFSKDLVYAKMYLDESSLQTYITLFRQLVRLEEIPDLLVIIKGPEEFLLERIKNRNRDFENYIDVPFLTRLKLKCNQMIEKIPIQPVVLDVRDFDVLKNPNDFDKLISNLGISLKIHN